MALCLVTSLYCNTDLSIYKAIDIGTYSNGKDKTNI